MRLAIISQQDFFIVAKTIDASFSLSNDQLALLQQSVMLKNDSQRYVVPYIQTLFEHLKVRQEEQDKLKNFYQEPENH